MAPEDLDGARVTIDGHSAGVLHRRLIVSLPAGAHETRIDSADSAAVVKRFHVRDGWPLEIRVLRTEVVKTRDAGACRCDVDPLLDPIAWATAVFRGRVTGIRETVEETVPMKVVTFAVTKWWQGSHSRMVVVRTWQPGTRYCGFRFTPGIEYIVYAWGPLRFYTDACTHTRPVSRGEGEMAWLNRAFSFNLDGPGANVIPLEPDDAAVIRMALAHLASCFDEKRTILLERRTRWYRMDDEEAAEDARLDLEDKDRPDLAAIAPLLIARLVDRNRARSAVVGPPHVEATASVSLPAYEGDMAAVAVTIYDKPPPCGRVIYLRRGGRGWRIVGESN